jgi:hypothetical protein
VESAVFPFKRRSATQREGGVIPVKAMPDEFQYDVFLSHSAKDKVVVRDVAERLQKDGVNVWFDEWVLKPGDNISAKIEEGIECSRVLVLCMSANAFGSDWAQLPGFTGSVNIEKDALDKLGLDDGFATKPLFIYIFIAKEKLTGLARYKAVGTHFEPGDEGKSVYS